MLRPRLSTLLVEVTQTCDHSCRHCYNYWSHPAWPSAPAQDRTDVIPLLARVLDQVECGHVTLTGGEPLLREDLPDIVDFLRARNIGVTLITNGHRLTDAVTADLIRRGVDLFELPLLSWRRDTHDWLSGCHGAFDAVLAALANIRFHRGRAMAVFVATRCNIADLGDTVKLACAFGVRGVMLNRFNPGGRGAVHIEELLPTMEDLRAALDAAEKAAGDCELTIGCSIPIQPCLIDTSGYQRLHFGFCAAGSNRAYYTLDTLGNVRPCNHTTTVLGNVWREPFADIISTERQAEFVAAAPGICSGCALRDRCQGGCKAAAQVCYGDLCAEEPFLRHNRAYVRLPLLTAIAPTDHRPAETHEPLPPLFAELAN